MNLSIKLVAAILIGLVAGAATGYGAEYIITQPQLNRLNGDLATANMKLANTTTTLTSRISKLQDEATTSTARIQSLNQQLLDLRAQLTSDANSTIAKLNLQIFDLQNTLSGVTQELNNLESRNVTLEAVGAGFVQDSGLDIPTNRTLTMKISWTRNGWDGTGTYTVVSTQANPDIGLYIGYVYALDVYHLTNVTVTGNTVNASGTVTQTDRPNILLEQPVSIRSTAKNDPTTKDQASVTWPSIGSNTTLLGKLKISNPPP